MEVFIALLLQIFIPPQQNCWDSFLFIFQCVVMTKDCMVFIWKQDIFFTYFYKWFYLLIWLVSLNALVTEDRCFISLCESCIISTLLTKTIPRSSALEMCALYHSCQINYQSQSLNRSCDYHSKLYKWQTWINWICEVKYV